MAYIVTVEHGTVQTILVQLMVEGVGNGALARAAQPGKPDHTPLMTIEGFPVNPGNAVFVPMYICIIYHSINSFTATGNGRQPNWLPYTLLSACDANVLDVLIIQPLPTVCARMSSRLCLVGETKKPEILSIQYPNENCRIANDTA
jgi:hypothetical protein